ncbi:ABC transporter permease [Quadrisphaera sp. INWT6]|uniref:ABC transporter permease n=1 Tax=Quadrisphaera sp. INWT6 TaxID=2596917 RepID=UPI001892217E|nr:ABC transporter permease [Quadrisphaera sp. INWT6]MBF5081562.1 ABC transporter permease [Quadrisphaera sp. INWT6]
MTTPTTAPVPASGGPAGAPAAGDGPAAPADRLSPRTAITYAVLTALALVLFALNAPDGSSRFRLSGGNDAVQLPELPLPGAAFGWLVVLVCLGVTLWVERERRAGRRAGVWAPAVFAAAWLAGFLVWVVAGQTISLVGLLAGGLVLSVPIVLGALGGVVSERAGVVNIAIEGQLLAGAFGAAVVASATGSAYAGLVAAPLAGAAVGLLLALFAIRYVVNQIIVGVVLNVLVIGLTNYLFTTLLSGNPSLNSPPGLLPVAVPLLSDIPLLGPVLFNQSIIVYITYALVAVVHVALFRTRWGLRVRAVGEHPKAADTVGIDVNRTRFINVVLSGALAGLGGAMLTLGVGLAFGEEMSAGKGYIALAAMIFGRYTPIGALVAALLFGVATNLQDILASIATPVPSQFLLMAPYLATVFAVAGLVGRVRAPAADGEPYVKQ